MALNRFFSSVFTDESAGMPDFARRTESILPDLELSVDVVSKKLSGLNIYSATGGDELSNRILRECASVLAPRLCALFKKSLDSSVLPADWRSAVVVPIHKGGSHYDPSNYRPVSLTPNVCKLMETLIRDHVMDFLSSI